MMKTKLYKYDSSQERNSYRGEDFSKYILSGDTETDDLTDVMGTVELTLAGLSFSEEFAPKTKFIYEKWHDVDNGDGTTSEVLWKYWHICVMEDLVSQPIISDDTYFDHHISFSEAGVDSQGRLVDNISITYRLKDVTLDGKIKVDEEAKAKVNIQNVGWNPADIFCHWENPFDMGYRLGKNFYWRFPNWFEQSDPNYGTENEWYDFAFYQAIDHNLGHKTISLPIPMLEIQNGTKDAKTFYKMGFCSTIVVVEEKNINTGVSITRLTHTINPATSVPTENEWNRDWDSGTGAAKGGVVSRLQNVATGIELYEKQVAEFVSQPLYRRITFDIYPYCLYTIKVYLKNFKTPTSSYEQYPSGYIYDENDVSYQSNSRASGFGIYFGSSDNYTVNNDYPTASISFMTYEDGTNNKVWLKSAPIENAYSLYQKAQINTQNVIKQQGIPIDETPQAYYVDPASKEELSNTNIVENFYNQKNWWELQLEIGKYIHAIPKVEFGSDDRFVTKWQKLGLPQQYEDNSHKISIFNSKSIENYISACSSYVSNMVQLGGVIDEWVAPKSSSEDYLVYNDVAEIKTSKNIIEIVDMEAKCINTNSYGAAVGEIRNLAGNGTHNEGSNGFVFEKNVYNLLDITAASLVNKGMAIYYELGTNIIKGLNYRLPTVNTGDGDNDYAIKRILGLVFGVSRTAWRNIRVNDFIFHIVYRTKDTVRSDQTRPDLRKYLLTSKYDRIPQHNQFNNQQDIVVDSVKFGNNIYGKLIRTGNTNYTVAEWNTDFAQIKQVGELYKIRGNIYYVAKVKNTYFPDHIISEITYSKDYNQLSEIIGIPSEPRFYEISEQSLIDREVSFNDYIVLTTGSQYEGTADSFIVRQYGTGFISGMLFGDSSSVPFSQNKKFPKYAITVFKNDEDRKYGTTLGNETFYKEICSPLNTYSIENTLTMEWDMADNFSAGDQVIKTSASITHSSPDEINDTAYNTLQPVQYTDVYGRSDLVDFMIMGDFDVEDYDLTPKQIQSLPNSPVRTRFPEYLVYVSTLYVNTLPSDSDLTNEVVNQLNRQPQDGDGIIVVLSTIVGSDTIITNYLYLFKNSTWTRDEIDNIQDYQKSHISLYENRYFFGNETLQPRGDIPPTMGDNLHGLGLMKDNREHLSFNYNLQMLTDSDRFVLSAYLWQPDKQNLKIALLNQEINKISNETLPEDAIIPNGLYDFTAYSTTGRVIYIEMSNILQNVDLTNVKAIAIISTDIIPETIAANAKYFVMGRNIGGLTEQDAKANWYIKSYDKSMFPHQ